MSFKSGLAQVVVFVIGTALMVVSVGLTVHVLTHEHVKEVPWWFIATLFGIGALPWVYLYRTQFREAGDAVKDVAEPVIPDISIGKAKDGD